MLQVVGQWDESVAICNSLEKRMCTIPSYVVTISILTPPMTQKVESQHHPLTTLMHFTGRHVLHINYAVILRLG